MPWTFFLYTRNSVLLFLFCVDVTAIISQILTITVHIALHLQE